MDNSEVSKLGKNQDSVVEQNVRRVKVQGGRNVFNYNNLEKNTVPKVTVITVVYNGEEHIEQTINSVITQDYENIEYIIVDGGSTDSTLDIVKRYDEQISYWLSETDDGIYDAMNKAISLSTGDVISLVNADDYLRPGVISEIVEELSSGIDILFAKGMFKKNDSIETHESNLSLIKYKMSVFHPAMVVTKEAYTHVGLYRTDFRIASDYEWILRALEYGLSWKKSKIVYSIMREGGISSNFRLGSQELYAIQKRHLGYARATLLYLMRIVRNTFR